MSKGPEGDREEGEIIDDEFEEISDNSMILSFNETGKSLSSKEHLPVISLSSVSEAEDEGNHRKPEMMRKMKKFHDKFRHHHRHHHHHHHHKWKRKMRGKYFGKFHKIKKWRRLLMNSSSSSSDDDSFDLELDRKLQTQLKAAIRVDTEDIHKNSLRARLKAMIKLNDNSIESHTDLQKNGNDHKCDNHNKIEEQKISSEEATEEADKELVELRLEALRTAVFNKFEHRKKRKIKEMQENQDIPKTDNLETNKENATNENINIKKPFVDKLDVIITPPDEDEDVLRALLLASMSKKMTKDVESKEVELPSYINTKLNQNNTKPNVFLRKPVVPFRQHIPPKIKPIIININSGTESEDETNKTTNNIMKDKLVPSNKLISSEIESSVDKFLREQRAKVEAQMVHKPVHPPVPLPKVATPSPQVVEPQTRNDSVILEKSSVKLLPKVKQIEYQKLLQRLKNAQKKTRTRRASFKGGDEVISTRKLVKNKTYGPGLHKDIDIKQDARTLHATLKQMQTQQNGRLQIEEKYVVLTPIIRKINEATTERKKYDQEVKRLTAELAEAKRKLFDTHRQFSTFVKELLTKKEEIDTSPPPTKKKKNANAPITSTPNKPKLPRESLEMSTVPCTPNSILSTSHAEHPVESLESIPLPTALKLPPNKPPTNLYGTPTFKTLEKVRDTINDFQVTIHATKEKDIIFKMDAEDVKRVADGSEKVIVNNVDNIERNRGSTNVDDDINPGDPNDIHRIYGNHHAFVPDYVSPLDSVKRSNNFDPFVIMCPYDIDGNCRDQECTYKHYSR